MSNGITQNPLLRLVLGLPSALAGAMLLALVSLTPHAEAGEPTRQSLIEALPPLELNAGNLKLQITPEMLAALPWTDIVTTTPWTKGKIRFSGPLLRDVIAFADASRGGWRPTVRAHAYDDYYVEIPADDTQYVNVIVAVLRDGQPMPRRNKGPFWIVYPLDDDAKAAKQWRGRMAWQLKAIEIR